MESIESDRVEPEWGEEAPLEAMRAVRSLLASSPIPHGLHWLRGHLGLPFGLRAGSVLARLNASSEVFSEDGVRWELTRPAFPYDTRLESFDPMCLVGPVWEPKFAEALRQAGLPVEQQRHELDYWLDIAVVSTNGVKFNVEVDGRTHRDCCGRRRFSDLNRDARLRAEGWTVWRVWVKDLMVDFEGKVREAVSVWNELKGQS